MFPRLLQTTRRSSFFLFGARGTGKTTYIRDAFDPDASLYVDLLDPEVEDLYRRTPGPAGAAGQSAARLGGMDSD